MKIAYCILELDRKENASILRSQLNFLDEIKSEICDARIEYPGCLSKYPEFDYIFKSITNVGFIGLWISLLNAFTEFLNTSYDAIFILEDDIKLHQEFERYYHECIKELPPLFGLFSFGYRQVYYSHYSELHSIKDKQFICKLFQSGDSWAILYSRAFISELLHVLKTTQILRGISDTAIFSYALGNVHPVTKLESFSIPPTIGSLAIHDNDERKSSIANSKIV